MIWKPTSEQRAAQMRLKNWPIRHAWVEWRLIEYRLERWNAERGREKTVSERAIECPRIVPTPARQPKENPIPCVQNGMAI